MSWIPRFLPLLCILCVGCSSKPPIEIFLVKVTGPDLSQSVQGDSFRDDSIKAEWRFEEYWIHLKLANQRETPVRILFGDAAVIDREGQSHRLILLNPDHASGNQQDAALSVPGGSFIKETLGSESDWDWSGEGWTLDPSTTLKPLVASEGFPPKQVKEKDGTARILSGPRDGDTIRIDLPIEVDGAVNVYRFEFGVTETGKD